MSDSVSAPAAPSAPAPSASSNTTNATSAPSAGVSGVGAAAPVTTKSPGDVTKSPVEFTKRQYKGKVDKQERVWELSDEEVAVRLQKAEAAESRFQKASDIQKKWEQLQQIAKEDPSLLIRELAGVDPQEYAQRLVEEKWKLEVMPEHDRKVYELEKKIKAYQDQEAKAQAAQQAHAKTQAEKAAEAQLEATFQRAFEVSGLEYNEDNLEVFGQLVLANHDHGLEYTPEQLAAEARSRIDERNQKYDAKARERRSGLKGNDLLDDLGVDVVKEVLRAAVARHTPKVPDAPAALPANSGTEAQGRDESGKFAPKKYLTTADWRKAFGK